MTVLLDANVLVALVVADHVHHAVAEEWLAGTRHRFATCPITEGQPADTATAVLDALASDQRHEFWADTESYRDVPMRGVIGHRQVTDAYLAQLARTRNGRLATFDQGLAKLHTDVVDLIPTP